MDSKVLGRIDSDIISAIREVKPLISTEYENYRKAVLTLMDINNNLDLFKVVFYI